jgi:hypothetical protein
MPIQVTKDQTSMRPRSKAVEVVVSAEDPALGIVGVTLCEMPAGLFEELEGETRDLLEEAREKNRAIADCRRKMFAAEDALTAGAWPDTSKAFDASIVAAELAGLGARVTELKAKRRELREAITRRKLELIAWGICDHRPSDFLTGDEENPFEATTGNYDGLAYRIAGPDTMARYTSAGQSLIDSLFLAVANWQKQTFVSPEEVWKAEREAKAYLEAALKKALGDAMERSVSDAIGGEDEAAELGALVDDSDPNLKRPTTTTTTPAQ